MIVSSGSVSGTKYVCQGLSKMGEPLNLSYPYLFPNSQYPLGEIATEKMLDQVVVSLFIISK